MQSASARISGFSLIRAALPVEGAETRLALGWGVLADCGIVLPWLVGLNGRGTLPGSSRWYLVVLGLAMVWYNQHFVPEMLNGE